MVEQKRTGRRILIILGLIFFAPLAVAWLMHFNVISWRPSSISANGELIQPPLTLESYRPTYKVKVNDAEFLRRKWHLLFISGNECGRDCEKSLILMRQVHASLGKYYERIGRVLAVPAVAELSPQIEEAFAGMEIITLDGVMQSILDDTQSAPGELIFLIDPLGNVMMRFPSDQEPRPMYTDMKRLLKLSRIG